MVYGAMEGTFLGYAMDGFPIFGPLADELEPELDACNGMSTVGVAGTSTT